MKPEDKNYLDVEDIVIEYAQKEDIMDWKEFSWDKDHVSKAK